MAHFAELNADNIVLRVIVVNNDMIIENGQESEIKGISFCQSLFGVETRWVQTSYNSKFRKNYAGIGYTYDTIRNAFIPPMPKGDGWVFNEETCLWRNPEQEAIAKFIEEKINIGVTRV